MRNIIALGALLSAIAIASLGSCTRPAMTQEPSLVRSTSQSRAPGEVSGTVYGVSGADTIPIAAIVSVVGAGHGAPNQPSGQYVLAVPAGNHRIRATAPGYLPRTVPVRVTARETETVDFFLTAQIERLVEISIEGNSVSVSPDPLYIAPGDSVVWFSDAGPWTVHFNPISPLPHRRIIADAGERLGGVVRADVFPGKYSYFVAVEVDGRILTADPDLIDENEEGPER